jgi:hypothetical protein
MQRPFALLLIVLALAACSKQDKVPMGTAGFASVNLPPPAPVSSPAPAGEPVAREAAPDQRAKYLAYEHTLQITADEATVAAAYEAVQAACRAAAVEECVVLRASLTGGPPSYASLQLRARPAGIRKLTALLGTQGEITAQGMNAEDLGGPIEDGDKKLAMLKDYRERLEDLRGRSANTIDSLIRVNQELAQVQSQIEAQAGTSAQLMRRVDTELLSVAINARAEQSAWQPVSRALAGFGANLAGAMAAAISTVAYALPFGILLLALAWGTRKLWRRRKAPARQ